MYSDSNEEDWYARRHSGDRMSPQDRNVLQHLKKVIFCLVCHSSKSSICVSLGRYLEFLVFDINAE
jgi:transcription elongation factor Elf1